MVKLPELAHISGGGSVFLAIPPITRTLIGKGALDATKATQDKCDTVLGRDVVNFWLKSTQLHCIALVAAAKRQVKKRDGDTCKLCDYSRVRLESLGKEPPQGRPRRPRVAHLATRRDAFWRIIERALVQAGDNPQWLFTNPGVHWIRAELKMDHLHSAPEYMVLLCRAHDDLIQKTLYPGAKEPADA